MKWGLKKPTDEQLREQIAFTRVYLVLFSVSIFFGMILWPTYCSGFLLFFAKVWLIIVCVLLVSQKQDKIRLEIRELKK